MGLLGALQFTLALVSLSQIPCITAQAVCSTEITSINSPDASSLRVKWSAYSGATNYLLDLRVINVTNVAPVVVTLPASSTEKVVHGLRPGTRYTVTVKVFQFYYVMCLDTRVSSTVPATSQITYSRALSSTSIRVEWARVYSAERYDLLVSSMATGENYNFTSSNLSAVVQNLQPSTAYDCYIYTANSAGLGLSSRVRTIYTLVQPPEGVTAVQTGRRSARVSWQPVNQPKVLLYEVTVRSLDSPGSAPYVTNVTEPELDVQNILPCSSYRISVSSVNAFLEPGDTTDYVYSTKTLSPVTSISVDYSCTSGSATVFWGAVFGADSYRAVATGSNGTVLNCTSMGTQCQLTGVGCGQSYVVRVTAVSASCESEMSNATTTFETVPCSPEELQLFRECRSNVIVFSWAPSSPTPSFYLAKAVDSTGKQMECMTTENSCFFTDTMCGRQYNFTVNAASGECNGYTSPSVSIRTAPCMPKNVVTSAECESKSLTTTWNPADGALLYMVEAFGNKGVRNMYNCSSSSTSCQIADVVCGESLSVHITAFDDDCPSSRTLGKAAETAPCIPSNVTAAMDCGSDSITLRWGQTHGALFYTGSAVDAAGVTHTCNSMTTSCQVQGLRCSTDYTAFVRASNLQCNGSASQTVSVETAPCPPDNITSVLDCATNSGLVTWQSQRQMPSYTATMEDVSGALLSCSTTGYNCTISSLRCGQQYAVSVMHHDSICPSMPSRPIYMESVPCGPANVRSAVDCASGAMTVGWDASADAESYTTAVTDGLMRSLARCDSAETHCNVDVRGCGDEYTVEVRSVTGSCPSTPSRTTVREVPCAPTNVTARRSCGESSVEVTWAASRGAQVYVAVCVGSNGHRTECTSNDTACRMDDLQCGQAYDISVLAVDDACLSAPSDTVTLQTVPCPPTNVTGTVDCGDNSVALSWDPSRNAVSYSAKAVGTDGWSVTCESTDPGCQMSGLRCGQTYVFTVSASDGSCESPDSQEFTQNSAPCAPENVTTVLDCDDGVLTTWSTSRQAPSHTICIRTEVWIDGKLVSTGTIYLNSTESSIRTAQPECGANYTVSVQAVDGTCNSTAVSTTVESAPCVPTNVLGVVDCASNALLASWDSAGGALAYVTTLTGPDNYSTSCSTDRLGCNFTNLECGALGYSVSVVASNSKCNSTVSEVVSTTTAPCATTNLTVVLECGPEEPRGKRNMDEYIMKMVAQWDPCIGAIHYVVVYERIDGGKNFNVKRNTTQVVITNTTSFVLEEPECGAVYLFSVQASDGKCNSTPVFSFVESAPCPPLIEPGALDCSTNDVSVSIRDPVSFVASYRVLASSTLGDKTQCRSNDDSCVLDDLLCGHTYSVYAIAESSKCPSRPSEAYEIVTAPCTPANVQPKYECGTGMALLTWDEALGRESFYARVQSGNDTESCSTAGTHCSLTSLQCGNLYDVTVDSVAGHCNSSQSGTAQIQTAPCAPQDVSASLVCADNTAAVTWLASPGATGYDVAAAGRDGDAKSCTSNGTSCLLPNMNCGQMYDITVTPFSETCRGVPSTTVIFTSGPCPPTEVEVVLLQCEDSVGSVSWVPSLAADLSMATATGSNGYNSTCSANGTSCSFGELNCGESYAVTVVTVSRGCMSEPSAPVTLRAALCPPSNLSGTTACGTNDLTITWDLSPVVGATYILFSQKEGGAREVYRTAETSQAITGLQCGERFSIRAAAWDPECTSALSAPFEIDTAPCPPTNISAVAKCGTTQTVIHWDLSAGAVTYTATVTGAGGFSASCTSDSNYCPVRVECGQHYDVAVVASTESCNSTASASYSFDSAPCLPANVRAEVDCVANTFAVQWEVDAGVMDIYMALALGSDGSRSSCSTSAGSCDIGGLRCGLTYYIAVTAESVDCGDIDTSDYMIQSAPCKPENPTMDLECSTNVVEVTWQNTGPDQRYVVSAVNGSGLTTTCTSTGSNCTFSQLSCGEAYTVSVVGETDTCSSAPSAAMQLVTAPCIPTHVMATVDCKTSIISVTWDPSYGATGYTVYANSSGGGDSCSNSDTLCTFSDLECGQNYTLVVKANQGSCSSLASEPITISTVPCPHSGLEATLDCSSNTAMVSWTPGEGTQSYNASAEGFDTAHYLSCATSGSSCNISALECGERYRVSVAGEASACPSPAREWLSLRSAPCPPTQLSVQSSCDSDAISVSWMSSKGSLSYTAVAESTYGHALRCNTSDTACSIAGLLCGQEYRVYAAGVDENCVSAKSEVEVVYTAPCMPESVHSDLDCPAGVLTVSWDKADNMSSRPSIHSYLTAVTSSEGDVSTCDSEDCRCVVAGIRCGLTYSVVVTAKDEGCASPSSPAQSVTAAPCPPDSVSAKLEWCPMDILMVSWNNSVAGVLYNVTAANQHGRRDSCSAAEAGCKLSSLECGTEYNMTVTPSRDGCEGVSSPYQQFRTVPCAPVLTEVEMDCLSDSAWVMWQESAGAEYYVAVATDSQGGTFECNSTEGMCAVPGLKCGQHFTFTVTAYAQECSSEPSNSLMSETVPCAPENVQANMSCENLSLSVSWTPSYGAVMYTATLEHADKKTTCCNTNETYCDIADLPCGEMYMLIVTAEGRTCNSSQSMGTLVRTAPCTLQSLNASLSCSTNVATVSWSGGGDGQRFSVEATAAGGLTAGCSSYESSCELADLLCGQRYTATVVAEDSACTSPKSSAVEIKTVPCIPANVSTMVDCASNALTVSWADSAGADSYTASVQDSAGRSTTCQAMSEGSCGVAGLSCGEPYHVTVVASDGYCSSPPTDVTDFVSAPCEPSLVEAVMDCEASVAQVSWFMAPGALSYVATASAASGHEVTCQTNYTNCELGDLACGESYSVFVKAYGESCSSLAHMSGQLVTEPCVPLHVTTEYSVSIAQVIWDESKGATDYTAVAVTDQGLRSVCTTNDSSCALQKMACSQVYNVSVHADNRVCKGVVMSDSVILMTEPCPPSNVQTRMDCETATGTVSWETSVGAVSYAVYLYGRNGVTMSCHTAATFCSLEGLSCGEVYDATVKALGVTFNSTESHTIPLVSAPCEPANVEAEVSCENNTVKVSWDWSEGAESYFLSATARDGQQASCDTVDNYCSLIELPCGQQYDLNLTAINNNCQVQIATGVSFYTRPCAPERVAVDLQCGTQTATVSWEREDGIVYYMASASDSVGGAIQYCNSSSSSCQFSGLDCGMTYRFSVTAVWSCVSAPSSVVEITTEPCQPDQLTADGTCNSEAVTLAWAEARGASAYVVTAMGDLGYDTAFRTNETTMEASLPCGQTYTFAIMAQDSRCDSPVGDTAEYTTAPCVPQYVESYTQCEDSMGAVSWAKSDGAESYTAVAVGQEDGQTYMCNTNLTTCTWNDLRCGDLYEIHVISNHYLCSSSPSNSTMIRTAPCVPQNLTSSLDCVTKVGTLTWDPSRAADFYIVTAETNGGGHKVEMSTNETEALISEFKCGEEYFLSVRGGDSECRSMPSPPVRQKTEPCPPTSVSSAMDCVSSIAAVSWEASAGAEFYTATALLDDGQETSSCMTQDADCGMSNLRCGRNYTVTVTASNQLCDSLPSGDNLLQTVPCVPTDVVVEMECSSNTAGVSWTASLGALSYRVEAKDRDDVEVSSCESNSSHCDLTGLPCGSTYYASVVAVGGNCPSLPSQSAEFQTVPCTPEIGGALLDCYTDSVLLEWAYVKGAVTYNATATAAGGQQSSCYGNYTNCELLDLTCGQAYTITMVASDGQCDSFQSASVEVASVPCPPQSVESYLDCSTNTARVQWAAASGADSYEVQAYSAEGSVAGCSAEETECVLLDLVCGSIYNISVISVSNECNVSESDIIQLQTVPCVPNQVQASVDCESGVVNVFWEPCAGATYYTAVAHGNGGYESSCNTSDTGCPISNLLCGLSYNVTVSASDDDMCSSAESATVQVNSVPCKPQMVSAEMDCSSDTGLVSWEQGETASTYMVQAAGPDGHRVQCSGNATGCRLPGMHCGQLYNLTVTTVDGVCDNSRTYLTLQSAPCNPTNVRASLRCASNSVAVTWERASGATSYQAVGATAGVGQEATCNNSLTFCDLTDLYCGRTYDVSVFAQDETCSSSPSVGPNVRTAPCPPQDVAVVVHCAAGAMLVSWTPDPDADSFQVTAVDSDGAGIMSCDSMGSDCSIAGVPCGHGYSVTVTAVRDGCEGEPSAAVQVYSAPCVPRNLEGSLDCVTNSAWMSWQEADGAHTYTVIANGVGGHNSSCTSSTTECNVPDLACATAYTFNVIATNAQCNSTASNTIEIETGPCALTTVTAETECQSSSIRVGWEEMEGSPLYVVTAEGQDRTFISCNSTSGSCELTDARCGMQYVIVVSTSSDKCSSVRSPPRKINTVPCTPEDVMVVESCEDDGAVVSWRKSFTAQFFLLTATGRDGDVRTCNTTVNNCTLSELRCGQTYSYSVIASANGCVSQASAGVTFSTEPCSPSGLSVDVQCETNSAVLSWAASEGSVEYYGCAATEDGEVIYCDSMDTSCTVEGLECGTMYNFSVRASDGVCNSTFSEPLVEGAAPCAPGGVRVQNLHYNELILVQVYWNAVHCPDVEYMVELTGRIKDDPQAMIEVSSYWTQRHYFEFALPCSTSYSVTVRSRNSAGISEPSAAVSGITVPCPPMDVTYRGDMASAVLSWEASVLATEYSVYNVTDNGRLIVCNTTELHCQLTDVKPGAIEVTASNAAGESVPTKDINAGNRRRRSYEESQSQFIGELHQLELSAPEVQAITVTKTSLYVEWTPVRGADYYTLVIQSTPQRLSGTVLKVFDTYTTVGDLNPSTRYCILLSARNSRNQSSYSKQCATTN